MLLAPGALLDDGRYSADNKLLEKFPLKFPRPSCTCVSVESSTDSSCSIGTRKGQTLLCPRVPETLTYPMRRTEGLVWLYRGFGASVATFVPSSGIWWGSYGAYQKFLWQQLDRRRPPRAVGEAKPGSQVRRQTRFLPSKYKPCGTTSVWFVKSLSLRC